MRTIIRRMPTDNTGRSTVAIVPAVRASMSASSKAACAKDARHAAQRGRAACQAGDRERLLCAATPGACTHIRVGTGAKLQAQAGTLEGTGNRACCTRDPKLLNTGCQARQTPWACAQAGGRALDSRGTDNDMPSCIVRGTLFRLSRIAKRTESLSTAV